MAMTLEELRDWHREKGGSYAAARQMAMAKHHYDAVKAIDAHLSAQAKVRVGDSNFESWLAEDFKAANKGTKQHLREAYEAGMNDPAARLSQGAQGDPLAGAVAEVLELERQGALDAEREKGLYVARKGVQNLFVDDAYPPDTIPDDWSDKPFARIQWVQEDGDPSVGMRGWAGWTLAANQKGTMVGALAEFCRTDPDNWERFNDLYNQTHEVP